MKQNLYKMIKIHQKLKLKVDECQVYQTNQIKVKYN